MHPSLRIYESGIFGVGQETEPFRALTPQSVALPFQKSPQRFDYSQYWQEPAITKLDWLFTPSPKLEEHLHVEPLRASTEFYLHFTLQRARSLGFGSHPSDSGHVNTPSLVNCGFVAFASDPLLQIILATKMHSLARYSKRTVRPLRAVPHDGY